MDCVLLSLSVWSGAVAACCGVCTDTCPDTLCCDVGISHAVRLQVASVVACFHALAHRPWRLRELSTWLAYVLARPGSDSESVFCWVGEDPWLSTMQAYHPVL